MLPGTVLALATCSAVWTLVGAGLGALLGLGLLTWAARAQAAGQEKLLRTVVEGVPMAIVLYGDSGHIAFTNAAAREFFFEGRAVEGQNFLSMLQRGRSGQRCAPWRCSGPPTAATRTALRAPTVCSSAFLHQPATEQQRPHSAYTFAQGQLLG